MESDVMLEKVFFPVQWRLIIPQKLKDNERKGKLQQVMWVDLPW